MNIQTAFIYCIMTIVLIYIILLIDNNFTNKENDDSCRILRTSVLCGFINWIIIVYFIYKTENEIPALLTNSQEIILNGKF